MGPVRAIIALLRIGLSKKEGLHGRGTGTDRYVAISAAPLAHRIHMHEPLLYGISYAHRWLPRLPRIHSLSRLICNT